MNKARSAVLLLDHHHPEAAPCLTGITITKKKKKKILNLILYFSMATLAAFLNSFFSFLYSGAFYTSKRQVSFDVGVPLNLWLLMVSYLDTHTLT